MRRASRGIAIAGAVFFLVPGLWAMLDPKSFYENLALFEPYNRHFIQDIGAFQIGLGAVLLVALLARADAIGVALLGTGIGSAAHTISHLVGRDLGGRPGRDITLFAIVSILLIAAGLSRAR